MFEVLIGTKQKYLLMTCIGSAWLAAAEGEGALAAAEPAAQWRCATHLLRWGPAERVKHGKNLIAITYPVPTQLNRFNYQVAYTGMADIYRTGVEP